MCLGAVPWAASRASGQAGPGRSSYPRPGQTALRCWPARHPGAPGSRSAWWVTISASSTTISDAAEVRVSTHRRVAAGVLAMPAAPIVCSRLPLSGPARHDTARGLPGPHRSVCAADGWSLTTGGPRSRGRARADASMRWWPKRGSQSSWSCPRRSGRGRRRPLPSHLDIDARDRLAAAVALDQAATLTTGSDWAEPMSARSTQYSSLMLPISFLRWWRVMGSCSRWPGG